MFEEHVRRGIDLRRVLEAAQSINNMASERSGNILAISEKQAPWQNKYMNNTHKAVLMWMIYFHLHSGKRSNKKMFRNIYFCLDFMEKKPLEWIVIKCWVGWLWRLQSINGDFVAVVFYWRLNKRVGCSTDRVDFACNAVGDQVTSESTTVRNPLYWERFVQHHAG